MKSTVKAEGRRKEIMSQISGLIDEDGLENLSIAQICKTASLSVGSFYHYFRSKKDIDTEIFRQLDNHIAEQSHQTLNNDDELLNLQMIAKSFVKLVSHWGYYCNRMALRGALSKEHAPYYTQSRIIKKVVGDITRRAEQKGQLHSQITAEAAARMMVSLILGYSCGWAIDQPEDIAFDGFDAHLELFLNSIAAKPFS